jgi:hypothetical protein
MTHRDEWSRHAGRSLRTLVARAPASVVVRVATEVVAAHGVGDVATQRVALKGSDP